MIGADGRIADGPIEAELHCVVRRSSTVVEITTPSDSGLNAPRRAPIVPPPYVSAVALSILFEIEFPDAVEPALFVPTVPPPLSRTSRLRLNKPTKNPQDP